MTIVTTSYNLSISMVNYATVWVDIWHGWHHLDYDCHRYYSIVGTLVRVKLYYGLLQLKIGLTNRKTTQVISLLQCFTHSLLVLLYVVLLPPYIGYHLGLMYQYCHCKIRIAACL